MRARIESIAVRTTIGVMGVDILQVLALVLGDTGIVEAGTIFQSCNIASEHACSASLQTAHEYILTVILIVALCNCISFHLCSLILAESSKMNSYLPVRRITEHKTAAYVNSGADDSQDVP